MSTDRGRFSENFMFGVVAGVLALVAGPGGLLVPLLTGATVFLTAGYIRRPKPRIAYVPRQALAAPDTPEWLIEDATKDLQVIQRIGAQVKRVGVKTEVAQLHMTGTRIVDYLRHHPEDLHSARKFLTYYLDTARKTLERYQLFESSGLDTEDMRRIRQSTEDALPTLNQAFEEQFEKLIANELIDVEADLKLLETDRRSKGGL